MADIFQGDFNQRDEEIKKLLHIGECFDILRRRIVVGGKQTAIYAVDGFCVGNWQKGCWSSYIRFQRRICRTILPAFCKRGYLTLIY